MLAWDRNRFAPVPEDVAPQPVSDAETHLGLERLAAALEQASAAMMALAQARAAVAEDEEAPEDRALDDAVTGALAALAARLAAQHDTLAALVERPVPAPVVHVPPMAVPGQLVDLLAAMAEALVERRLTLDDDTIKALQRAVAPRITTGTMREEVFVKNEGGTRIDPATDGTVGAVRDRLPDALDPDGGVKVHLQNPGADRTATATAPATLSVPTTAGVVVAARAGRKKLLVQNSHLTAKVFIGYGANPTTTTGLQVLPGGVFEEAHYTGAIHALTDHATAITVPYVELG